MLNKLPKKRATNEVAKIHTLLVDGNALFKTGYHGAKNEVNRKGEHIGGVYQFLTMLRKLMNEKIYHNIYVFWDGIFSGKLRFNFYPPYKSGRGKDYINGTLPLDDADQILEQLMIKQYLEELSIKQLEDEIVESDDFIAYYVLNRKPNEFITICTNDSDICQLIGDNVTVYKCDKKIYITKETYSDVFGFKLENAVLVKMLCGDSSDDIKGVKGIGLKTLLDNFPELSEKEVSLDDIISKAKELQQNRIENKKKPLQILTNLIDGVSTGIFQGEKLYDVNYRLINLKEPLLTEIAINNITHLRENILSGEDRSIKDVMKMIKEDGLIDKIGDHNLDSYLLTFKKFIERYKNTTTNI